MRVEKVSEFAEYTKGVLKTESVLPQETPIDYGMLWVLLRQSILSGDMVDQYKRKLFYKKEIDRSVMLKSYDELCLWLLQRKGGHCLNPYQEQQPSGVSLRTIHAVLGILTESAELAQTLLKGVFAGGFSDDDRLNLLLELGDLLWYLALLCDDLGFSIESVMSANLAKLQKRYGDKFSEEKAVNRDTAAEDVAASEAVYG
jgi:NTP pyrophosphatase (non-canonical NTP hydrolase)